MKVQITCPKDPSLEKHCQQEFGENWNTNAPDYAKLFGVQQLQQEYQEILRQEAIRQEWYDYTHDNHGARVVLTNSDGTKKLLVPEVKIID